MRKTMETIVTPVIEQYLESIHGIERRKGAVRNGDVVEAMGLHKSTVSTMLKGMKAMGLIGHQPYETIALTDAGRKLAERIAQRNEVLRTFLTDALSVNGREAARIASKTGSFFPDDIVEKLAEFTDAQTLKGRACLMLGAWCGNCAVTVNA